MVAMSEASLLHAGVGETHDENNEERTPRPITPECCASTAATRRGTTEKFSTVDQRRMSDLRLYPDVPGPLMPTFTFLMFAVARNLGP